MPEPEPEKTGMEAQVGDYRLTAGNLEYEYYTVEQPAYAGRYITTGDTVQFTPDTTPEYIHVSGSYDAAWPNEIRVDVNHLDLYPAGSGFISGDNVRFNNDTPIYSGNHKFITVMEEDARTCKHDVLQKDEKGRMRCAACGMYASVNMVDPSERNVKLPGLK